MAIKRSSQRSRSHRKGSTIVCRIREGGGGRFRQNKHLSGEVLPYSLPIQSKLNILQWMKFSMCKRGLCTHWLIWLFRKWVGIETMKLWVQWLWGEGSYQSILLLFGRSLDVSCLIHGYYTRLLYTVTIHTIVEDAVLYTVTIHTSHVLYGRLLYILLWKLLSHTRLLYIRLMSYTDGYYTYYCWSCLHACGLHQDWTIVRPMPRSQIALTSKNFLLVFEKKKKNFLLLIECVWQGNQGMSLFFEGFLE